MWHYKPTIYSLVTFLPSPIFKSDLDNADRSVMSRTYSIMKREIIWLRASFDFGFQRERSSEII
jgi:hypothetical protein